LVPTRPSQLKPWPKYHFYGIFCFMNMLHFQLQEFPNASRALTEQLEEAGLEATDGSLAVFGGSARSGVLEATEGIKRPIRDVDLVAIGNDCDDESYKAAHMRLNPNDDPNKIFIPRFPDVEGLFSDNVDFTINQAAIELVSPIRLTASSLAVEACRRRIIQITGGRIKQTEHFLTNGNSNSEDKEAFRNWKKFLRNRTGMPARAAYFAATLRAAGFDFDYDLQDHPKPESPEEAHTFFLGLMVNKALQVDEAERGPGDITATRILFDLYEEMGLTNGVKPAIPEQVAAYCETVNSEHPQLKFHGSEVAGLVKHTDKAPAPRIV
jgi:hypothetical protein